MKLAEAFVDIGARTGSLDRSLAGVRSRLNNVLGKSFSLGGAGGLLGAAAVALVGKKIVETAADFETSMGEIRKTTGLAAPELEQLKNELFAISTSRGGTTLDELTSIAGMAGRLGISGVESLTAFTDGIALMHNAMSDIPVEELTTATARILKQFHMGPEAAISFGSALNKLDDSSTATGRDILDVATRLTGAMSKLDASPQQVLALSAAIKDAGIENEVGGTAFSQIFAKMATSTEKFAKVAGVSTEEFAKIVEGDPLQALVTFENAIKGMGGVEGLNALKTLGLDGARTSMSLLQLSNVIGSVDGYVGMANDQWRTHASILAENAIKQEQTNAQFERIGSSIKIMAIGLGSALTPSLTSLADLFGEVATGGAGKLSEAFSRIHGWMESITGMSLSVSGALEEVSGALSAIYHNWSDVAEMAALNAMEFFEQFGNAAVYFKDQFIDVFNAVVGVGANIGKNLGMIIREVYDYIASFGENPIELRFTSLMEGIDVMAPAATASKFAGATMSTSSKYAAARQEIMDHMVASETARIEENQGLAAAAAYAPLALAPGTPGGMAAVGETMKAEASKSEIMDANSFSRSIQQAAGGSGSKEDEIAKNTAETAESIKVIADKGVKIDKTMFAGIFG